MEYAAKLSDAHRTLSLTDMCVVGLPACSWLAHTSAAVAVLHWVRLEPGAHHRHTLLCFLLGAFCTAGQALPEFVRLLVRDDAAGASGWCTCGAGRTCCGRF